MDLNTRQYAALNRAIDAFNLAKEASNIMPAKAVFGSASVALAVIRVGSFLTLVGHRLIGSV